MGLTDDFRGAFLQGATEPTALHSGTTNKGRDVGAMNDGVCFLFPSASLWCLLALLWCLPASLLTAGTR